MDPIQRSLLVLLGKNWGWGDEKGGDDPAHYNKHQM